MVAKMKVKKKPKTKTVTIKLDGAKVIRANITVYKTKEVGRYHIDLIVVGGEDITEEDDG